MLLQSSDGFDRVIAGNKQFIERITSSDPSLLSTLAKGQSPEVLWIGCADSRVPETTICACKPGDIFVHRNIANVVHPHDLSSASVIEYAVNALKVKRVVVCGHTKCGGANAALGDGDLGDTLNTWLSPVRDLRRKHQELLNALDSEDERITRLAELNVRKGIETLKKNPTVVNAMKERRLTLHGVIYDISAGELRVIHDEREAKLGSEHHTHNGKKSEDTGQPVVPPRTAIQSKPLAVQPLRSTIRGQTKDSASSGLWSGSSSGSEPTSHQWLSNH